MTINAQDLKILLLQIRREESVRVEEFDSFVSYSGLDAKQIDVLNLFDDTDILPSRANGYHAIWIGGASEASVLEPETYPFVDSAIALIQYCVKEDIPVFASCFGFQLAVLALGGDILHVSKGFEMGSIPISLHESAKQDPLFKDTPDGFYAVSVHREKTNSAPSNCTALAYTDQCCHAFKVNGKDFWAFQFHPEVDKQTLVERLTVYKNKYTDSDGHLDEVLSNAVETPESNLLLSKFVTRVLLKE